MKVLRRCLFVMIPILALLTFYWLYAYGVIFKYDPVDVYDNAVANIRIVESEKENIEGSYVFGYFASPNKIILNNYEGDHVFECTDSYGNVYNIKDIDRIGRIMVITTEEKNNNPIRYQPFPFKNEKTVFASLGSKLKYEDEEERYILQSGKKHDIIDRRAVHYGEWFVLCDGKIERGTGMPAFSPSGRVIGMTLKGGDSFFVYTHYEIMKEIIIHNIKEMLGIA